MEIKPKGRRRPTMKSTSLWSIHRPAKGALHTVCAHCVLHKARHLAPTISVLSGDNCSRYHPIVSWSPRCLCVMPWFTFTPWAQLPATRRTTFTLPVSFVSLDEKTDYELFEWFKNDLKWFKLIKIAYEIVPTKPVWKESSKIESRRSACVLILSEESPWSL